MTKLKPESPPLRDVILTSSDGRRWKVREAISENAALNAIAHARVTGSIGSKDVRDSTLVGGTVVVLADVVSINSDGTERQPYTEYY